MSAELLEPIPALTFGTIPNDNAEVAYLLNRLEQKTPAFRHQRPFSQPKCWYGVTTFSGAVLAAIGFDAYEDGTIHLRYAVARPSRAGSTALGCVMDLMDRANAHKRVIFYSQATNRRMAKMAARHGFRAEAIMYERGAQ